jgi:hypothetical protein
MVFKGIAQEVGDFYNSDKVFKAIVNTFSLYGGAKLTGLVATAFTGNKDWEDITDLVAPSISGIYALNESKGIEDGFIKGITQIALAGIIGWDLSDAIYNYHGSNDALRGIRDTYSIAYVKAANALNWHSPSKVGFGIGAASGTLAKIAQYSRKK